jgi:hypothetical protein
MGVFMVQIPNRSGLRTCSGWPCFFSFSYLFLLTGTIANAWSCLNPDVLFLSRVLKLRFLLLTSVNEPI